MDQLSMVPCGIVRDDHHEHNPERPRGDQLELTGSHHCSSEMPEDVPDGGPEDTDVGTELKHSCMA
ncbi:hypothetical protein N7523_007428 [Penicillium sp. IBT 18751x]|nr:hypothetical protein N7523_007428 [Penicillium sp. IBT 18751x]